MTKMGFHPEIINMSLRHVSNNMGEAVDMLLRMQGEGTYDNLLASICGSTSTSAATTSTGAATALETIAKELVNSSNTSMEDDSDALAVRKTTCFGNKWIFIFFLFHFFSGLRTIF